MAAIRPATLPAAIAPVAVGTALAAHDRLFDPPAAIAALLGALLIQVGTNLANDYFDWRKGADTSERLGPPRVTQQGWLTPRQVGGATAIAFAMAAIAGAYLVSVAGWPIALLGLVCIAAGVAYTAGPFPLGYHGLGELAVLIFFGPVALCGTYYVQAHTVSREALLASLPIGALTAALLVVNNIRDRETDAAAGKRTLAVRLGLLGSRIEYALLMLLPYALLPVVVLLGLVGFGWLAPLVSLPFAAILVRSVARRDGAQLLPCLPPTARLALLYGMLLAVGVSW